VEFRDHAATPIAKRNNAIKMVLSPSSSAAC
jgi:hypothetical protein